MEKNTHLTFKDIELKFRTTLLKNRHRYEQHAAILFERLKGQLEHVKPLYFSKDELVPVLKKFLIETRNFLLTTDKVEITYLLAMENPEEMIKGIESINDDEFNVAYGQLFKDTFGLNNAELERAYLQMNELTDDHDTLMGVNIVQVLAYQKYFEYLKKELEIIEGAITDNTVNIGNTEPVVNWTRTKADFYKFVYGLFHSKAIHQNSGITKTMVQMASVFGVELAKDWQTGASKTTGYDNGDFDNAKVFEDLKTGYLEYIEGLEEKKRKK